MGRRVQFVAALATVVFVVATAGPASAAPSGTLDTTFGSAGIVVANLSDFVSQCSGFPPSCGPDGEHVQGLVVQPSGAVVVATTWSPDGGHTVYGLLVRFDTTGHRDLTFGTGGAALIQYPTQLGLQSDGLGRLYLSNGNRVIRRYDANGHADVSWATGGRLVLLGGVFWRVAPDGTLYEVFGSPAAPPSVVLDVSARYLPNGTLDPTWGTNGFGVQVIPKTIAGGYTFRGFDDLGVTAAGGLVMVGSADRQVGAATEERVVLGHVEPTGHPDTTFGPGGIQFPTDPAGVPGLYGFASSLVTPLPDGRTLVGGGRSSGTTASVINVARFLANGRPDTTFGYAGVAVVDFTADAEVVTWMDVDSAGRTLVVAAVPNVNGGTRLAVARLLPNGTFDPSYGTGGRSVLPFDPTQDFSPTVGLGPDGSVLIGGGLPSPTRQCDSGGLGLWQCPDLLLEKVRS